VWGKLHDSDKFEAARNSVPIVRTDVKSWYKVLYGITTRPSISNLHTTPGDVCSTSGTAASSDRICEDTGVEYFTAFKPMEASPASKSSASIPIFELDYPRAISADTATSAKL